MITNQTEPNNSEEQEDFVNLDSKSKPSSNPFARAASISVSVPESVEVKLVDASALEDYEVWVLLTSISSSAFFGFLVATIQDSKTPEQPTLIWMSIFLLVIMIAFAVTAFRKRRKLSARARRLKFLVGEQVDET